METGGRGKAAGKSGKEERKRKRDVVVGKRWEKTEKRRGKIEVENSGKEKRGGKEAVGAVE